MKFLPLRKTETALFPFNDTKTEGKSQSFHEKSTDIFSSAFGYGKIGGKWPLISFYSGSKKGSEIQAGKG